MAIVDVTVALYLIGAFICFGYMLRNSETVSSDGRRFRDYLGSIRKALKWPMVLAMVATRKSL